MSLFNRHFQQALEKAVGADEVRSVTRILKEHLREQDIAHEQHYLLDVLARLQKQEPLQYILGYAWFYGKKIAVNGNVLIPRPETEELAHWISTDYRKPAGQILRIADIGTGSGCIAIALKSVFPAAEVHAFDISQAALRLARTNARVNQLEVMFHQVDFIEHGLPGDGVYDIMASNPPYISKAEMAGLPAVVRDYEPPVALVPDSDDSLIFYRRLAEVGRMRLAEGGRLYCELNEHTAEVAEDIFREAEYQTELRRDMQGKRRMIRASR